MRRYRNLVILASLFLLAPTMARAQKIPDALRQQATQHGSTVASVKLDTGTEWKAYGPESAKEQGNQLARTTQAWKLLKIALAGTECYEIEAMPTIAAVLIKLHPSCFETLEQSKGVKSVHQEYYEGRILVPQASETRSIVEAASVEPGENGTGLVFYVGTGIDSAVVEVVDGFEACFTSGRPAPGSITEAIAQLFSRDNIGVCPNDTNRQVLQPGAGRPCTHNELDCKHDTVMAGIGNAVAPGADIVPVRVIEECGVFGSNTCAHPWNVDRALQWIFLQFVSGWQSGTLVSAVVIPMATPAVERPGCDARWARTKEWIDVLRAYNIPVVFSAGNIRNSALMAEPACISSAVSVGAVTKSDAPWAQASLSQKTTLVAPGVDVVSPLTGIYSGVYSGSSISATVVVSLLAGMKAKLGSFNLERALAKLQITSQPIQDVRLGEPQFWWVHCRVRMGRALEAYPRVFIEINAEASNGINRCGQTAGGNDDGLFVSGETETPLQVPQGMEFALAEDLDDLGRIAGYGWDGDQFRGIIWVRGRPTVFDAPGGDTIPHCIISRSEGPGELCGEFVNSDGKILGFEGTVTCTRANFESGVPSVCNIVAKNKVDIDNSLFVHVTDRNEDGDRIGFAYMKDVGQYKGFFQSANGTLLIFEPPGARATHPIGLTRDRQITGYFQTGTPGVEGSARVHGFHLSPDGAFTVIDHPDANPIGTLDGTYLFKITETAQAVGMWARRPISGDATRGGFILDLSAGSDAEFRNNNPFKSGGVRGDCPKGIAFWSKRTGCSLRPVGPPLLKRGGRGNRFGK